MMEKRGQTTADPAFKTETLHEIRWRNKSAAHSKVEGCNLSVGKLWPGDHIRYKPYSSSAELEAVRYQSKVWTHFRMQCLFFFFTFQNFLQCKYILKTSNI